MEAEHMSTNTGVNDHYLKFIYRENILFYKYIHTKKNHIAHLH